MTDQVIPRDVDENEFEDVDLEAEDLDLTPNVQLDLDDAGDDYTEAHEGPEPPEDPGVDDHAESEDTAAPEPPQPQSSDPESARLGFRLRQAERDRDILMSRLGDALNALQQHAGQPAPSEDPKARSIPDPEEDLQGYLTGTVGQLAHQIDQDRQTRDQEKSQQALAGEFQQAQSAIAQYRSQDPEGYDQAVWHLLTTEAAELMDEYPTDTQEEIAARLQVSMGQRVVTWWRAGRNPAEVFVARARRRGWAPQPMVPFDAEDGTAPSAHVDEQTADQPRQRGVVNPRERIRSSRHRERKARTLSAVPGASAGEREVTPKRALQMAEDEWDQTVGRLSLREQLSGKGFR